MKTAGRIFMKFRIWVFIRKFIEHIQISLKSDKNNGHFTWRPLDVFSWNFVFEYLFENLSSIFKYHWNLTRLTGTLHEDQYGVFITSRSFLLRMGNVSHKIGRENQNTHSITFSWKSCRSWDNVEKYCRNGQAAHDNMAHAHFMSDT